MGLKHITAANLIPGMSLTFPVFFIHSFAENDDYLITTVLSLAIL